MASKKTQLIGRLRDRREKKSKSSPESSTKEHLDVLSSLFGVATKGALAFGLTTLIFYLGAAQHVVTGVNLTEGILLAALALVLGILGVGVLIIGTLQVYPQVNFLMSAAASGASSRHLTRAEKVSLYAFCAAVIAYSIGVPLVIRQLLEYGHNQLGLSALGVGALLAIGVGGWWVRILRMCAKADSSTRARFDAWGEGFNAAMFLFFSSCLWLLLGFVLSAKILAVFSVIGFLSALGFSLMVSSGIRVVPGWRAAGRTLLVFAFIIATTFSIFVPAFGGETGAVKAFQSVALNAPQATLAVSPANLERLERIAGQHDRPLNVCRNADGSATVTDVRVLWHTLGANGLVELWSEPTDPELYSDGSKPHFRTSWLESSFRVLGWRGVRVPLDNSGLAVISGSNLHCLELDGLLFDTNSSILSVQARTTLYEQLNHLHTKFQQIKNAKGAPVRAVQRIEIIGHADPRRRLNGTNEELAKQRAESVKAAVSAWIDANSPEWKEAAIAPRSEGSREQARKCTDSDAAESEACNAFNRRVVLRMISGPT